jgi:hypothetical protein
MKCYCSQLETGPKLKTARRLARARRAPRARSHRGPGPGRPFPTWATTRSGNREPSIYIQRPRMESGLPAHHSERATNHARRWMSSAEEDGAAASPLTGARARRWVDAPQSSGSSAGPYPHGHGGSRARSHEWWLEIYPCSEWIHPQLVVADLHKRVSPVTFLLHLKKLRSSPSIFFYPDLDPHA